MPKEGSIDPPKNYLGVTLGKQQIPDGREVWYMSGEQYVKRAVNNIEYLLEEDENGMKLNSKLILPIYSTY